MFEQLFQRPYTVVRHQDGPLAEERLRYLRHLAEQGMCRRYLKVVASRLLIIIDYLRLANRPTADIDLTEIEQQASLWAKRLAKGEQRKYSWIASVNTPRRGFDSLDGSGLQFQSRNLVPT